MRKLLLPVLTLLAGCHVPRADVPLAIEAQVSAVATARVAPDAVPCAAATPAPSGPLDLAAVWQLAVENNPSLREAAAEVEVARGRLTQARLYPNPRLLYDQDTIGARIAPQGNIVVQMTQEIVTAGKRRLDVAVATRQTDAASLALLGRKFEVLTRVRRGYYNYVGWAYAERANEEVVAVLEQGLRTTRRLVEEAKTRPRTDLLRIEALLEEARISLARSRAIREGAWKELAAEVGLPGLPPLGPVRGPLEPVPAWGAGAVEERVLAANTSLKQAAVEAERARLALERAKAQAVPNVTVGGGYSLENIDQTAGGLVTVDVPVPLWDRNQGSIHAAKAAWAQAQAAMQTTATRLSRETAAAFATYQAARQQVERLEREVLPRVRESLELLTKGYEAGSAQATFLDLLLAEQSVFAVRVTLAEARRTLWLAVADLQGLMQLDLGEDLCVPAGPAPH